MSRFKRLSHAIWHCQYHIVWVPKYRHRVLKERVGKEVYNCVQVFAGRLGCTVVELNVQPDHVHLLALVPPKVSISNLMGSLKGRTAIRIFKKFPYLRQKPYWGNHFWAPGYCVDTVGLNKDMIRKYVKYQEKHERLNEEQKKLEFRNVAGTTLLASFGCKQKTPLGGVHSRPRPLGVVFYSQSTRKGGKLGLDNAQKLIR